MYLSVHVSAEDVDDQVKEIYQAHLSSVRQDGHVSRSDPLLKFLDKQSRDMPDISSARSNLLLL